MIRIGRILTDHFGKSVGIRNIRVIRVLSVIDAPILTTLHLMKNVQTEVVSIQIGAN